MSFNWPSVRLGELADITSSKRIKRADYVTSGVPFFRSKEVIERSKGNDISTELFISEEQFAVIRDKFGAPEAGDILLTSVGTLGVPYQVRSTDRFYFKDGNLTWLRKFKESVLPEYVLYWLRSPVAQRKLDEVSIGSTQRALTIVALKSVEIPLPPKAVQARIVDMAMSLDQKLEINRNINQTLEQMAQAIFKSWFIDFEPVKTKIAALEAGGSKEDALLAAMQAISGKGEAELTRLQAEQPEQYAELRATAELFPSAMQDSELGEIPEGWPLSTVGHEFDVTMGQSPPGDTYNEEGDGAPFFQGRRDFGERFPSNRVYCSAPKRMANEGDTLLSVRAPVGDTNIALTNCCIGRGLAALRYKSGCSSYTYYSIIQLGQALSSYDSEGTVFGSINQKNLKAIPVVAPAIDVLAAFTRTVGAIDEFIRVNSEEASSLAYTRDTLLPKLLSGELSVPGDRDEIECEPLSTIPEVE